MRFSRRVSTVEDSAAHGANAVQNVLTAEAIEASRCSAKCGRVVGSGVRRNSVSCE